MAITTTATKSSTPMSVAMANKRLAASPISDIVTDKAASKVPAHGGRAAKLPFVKRGSHLFATDCNRSQNRRDQGATTPGHTNEKRPPIHRRDQRAIMWFRFRKRGCPTDC